jgi:saccharopine dehydrogenase-like NADP-dependent oxidoreductase
MKNILVLGSGFVSKPGIKYLLSQNEFFITVASLSIKYISEIMKEQRNGIAIQLDVNNTDKLIDLIKKNDIVISLLPWTFHIDVAKLCIEYNTHLVTTSYVSADMRSLDSKVKNKNLLFLNEMGIDPGIDHMSAMKIINEVHKDGGKIVHFYSFCGGLPAPEHNNNPFGYKFSWSPKGVVLASRNSALYLENGENITIEGKDLFKNPRQEHIVDLGTFEVYPNRDSLQYKNLYGLKDALTVMRGTYRNIGWCETLKAIVDIGLIDETPDDSLKEKTYQQMIRELLNNTESKDIRFDVAHTLNIDQNSPILDRLEWLGLFSDKNVMKSDNKLDNLSELLQKKLYFKPDERDMILLQHKFIIKNEKNEKKLITSTLIEYGIPNGDSSMARTVSLPLAIGVKLILDKKINLTGVRIPIMKEIYKPVLLELEQLGIKMNEQKWNYDEN